MIHTIFYKTIITKITKCTSRGSLQNAFEDDLDICIVKTYYGPQNVNEIVVCCMCGGYPRHWMDYLANIVQNVETEVMDD